VAGKSNGRKLTFAPTTMDKSDTDTVNTSTDEFDHLTVDPTYYPEGVDHAGDYF
jgi:hypothetical protein